MIKDFFHRTGKPLGEFILQTARELGKCYSRLELASLKLMKRDKDLFDACSFLLRSNSKARATIYANEVAEIRRVLSILQRTQLSVEQAILRLDTLKVVSPTVESVKEAFGDVRNALGLVANVMPSILPEMDKFNSAIGEILEETQLNVPMPVPLVVNDPTAEAILREAAIFVEQELQTKMPEPPVDLRVSEPAEPSRPLVAIAADGTEIYIGKDYSVFESDGSSGVLDGSSNPLLEELVMDYIERNNGEMNVNKCSGELEASRTEVLEALGSLSRKGKIRIEQ